MIFFLCGLVVGVVLTLIVQFFLFMLGMSGFMGW